MILIWSRMVYIKGNNLHSKEVIILLLLLKQLNLNGKRDGGAVLLGVIRLLGDNGLSAAIRPKRSWT